MGWRGQPHSGLVLLLLISESPHAGLQEHGVTVYGLVLLIPADIATAVMWTRLVDAAHVVLVEELAGLVALLDALFATLRDLHDVAFLKIGNADAEVLC